MKTDKDFNTKSEGNQTIFDNMVKHDNTLNNLFSIISKYNSETTKYKIYCDNLNDAIKKDFSDIKEIVYDKVNDILKAYSQTSSSLSNEQIKLKSEIEYLQKENEELLSKIDGLKEKITKMERVIGIDKEDINKKNPSDRKYQTK